MIHEPGVSGGMAGKVTDLEIYLTELSATKQVEIELLAQHTGQPPERIAQDIERDYWMSAEEAMAYGLVDHISRTREGNS